ncbi:3-keto-disaccharide hydrolase [Runella slithyformis]|uniref:3-keto-alpha-glucoside-1,2-lyase/3-keto-2-hydroxy-glucal hydratase domain-containing protein n=1 Tax=Runella slithyformis (strain ATCC 29530 / DSM 19594 / LMG 11500 / NCIMB 11436 / LSU 4) TaxID=761193 RepID=A0A7U4E6K7_RUNSL|nr:DUF1080 domain-containing protein [Runella slithyformis]AEI49683.1 protein of unknown function DUF1080 [Runella slithyformis DSM 19594]
MIRLPLTCLFTWLLGVNLCHAQSSNTLTQSEKKSGWVLLFDGKTTNGWRGAYSTDFPKHGWVVKEGELRGELSTGAESGDAGDIVTLKKYKNFELVFEWKLGKGGNSGVKYFIEERRPKPDKGSQAGYEYQLIDDANYIYNGKPLPQDLKTASIYDVMAARKPDAKVEVWHSSRIIVNDNHIEHWLDGQKVLNIDRNAEAFKQGVQDSKFKEYQGFTAIPEGHILLQDHGHSVAFKNIKLKEL